VPGSNFSSSRKENNNAGTEELVSFQIGTCSEGPVYCFFEVRLSRTPIYPSNVRRRQKSQTRSGQSHRLSGTISENEGFTTRTNIPRGEGDRDFYYVWGRMRNGGDIHKTPSRSGCPLKQTNGWGESVRVVAEQWNHKGYTQSLCRPAGLVRRQRLGTMSTWTRLSQRENLNTVSPP